MRRNDHDEKEEDAQKTDNAEDRKPDRLPSVRDLDVERHAVRPRSVRILEAQHEERGKHQQVSKRGAKCIHIRQDVDGGIAAGFSRIDEGKNGDQESRSAKYHDRSYRRLVSRVHLVEPARNQLELAHRIGQARHADDPRIGRDVDDDPADQGRERGSYDPNEGDLAGDQRHRVTLVPFEGRGIDHSRGEDGEGDRKEQHRENQADRGAGDDGCRPAGFLRHLGDRFEADKGDDGQRGSEGELSQAGTVEDELMRQQIRIPDEHQTGDHDEGLGSDRDHAQHLIDKRRDPDAQ